MWIHVKHSVRRHGVAATFSVRDVTGSIRPSESYGSGAVWVVWVTEGLVADVFLGLSSRSLSGYS